VHGLQACGWGLEEQRHWGNAGEEMKSFGMMSAQRGQNWCPHKGSVHGQMGPSEEQAR
jgi:hypothetical protein